MDWTNNFGRKLGKRALWYQGVQGVHVTKSFCLPKLFRPGKSFLFRRINWTQILKRKPPNLITKFVNNTHAENSILDLVKLHRISIVVTLFRLIRHLTEFGPISINDMQTPLKSGHVEIKDAQCAETNLFAIFLFELWSILYSKFTKSHCAETNEISIFWFLRFLFFGLWSICIYSTVVNNELKTWFRR